MTPSSMLSVTVSRRSRRRNCRTADTLLWINSKKDERMLPAIPVILVTIELVAAGSEV